MKKIFISILLCLLAFAASAQLKGVVRDSKGNVLAGANVVWKGTNLGTTTDGDGLFFLQTQPDVNEIVTSFVGFFNDTTQWNGTIFVEISMKEGIDLDDVVIKASRPGIMKARGAQNIEIITNTELVRAACCNLGESFTTNPSVDVDYSDAATGARQIKLLGLVGLSQFLSTPTCCLSNNLEEF